MRISRRPAVQVAVASVWLSAAGLCAQQTGPTPRSPLRPQPGSPPERVAEDLAPIRIVTVSMPLAARVTPIRPLPVTPAEPLPLEPPDRAGRRLDPPAAALACLSDPACGGEPPIAWPWRCLGGLGRAACGGVASACAEADPRGCL